MTTATLTAQTTDAFGFPTVTCYRCGGSGKFSWNAITGDRCFGCQGSGVCWKRGKVAKAAHAFHEARRKARNPIIGNLVKGQIIAMTAEGSFTAKGKTWWTFESMEIDYTQVTGSSKDFGTNEYVPIAWKCTLTVSQGETTMQVQAQTNYIITGKMGGVDVTPFLIAAGVKKEN